MSLSKTAAELWPFTNQSQIKLCFDHWQHLILKIYFESSTQTIPRNEAIWMKDF